MTEPPKDPKPADPEWLELYNAALDARGRGSRTRLADHLGVDPSTVTRIGQGVPHTPGLLHRASLELGIRDPTTIPLDDLQQRILRCLDEWRRTMPVERAGEIVAMLETRTATLREAIADYMASLGRAATTDQATAQLQVREALEGLGVMPVSAAVQSLIRKILERKIEQATIGLERDPEEKPE